MNSILLSRRCLVPFGSIFSGSLSFTRSFSSTSVTPNTPLSQVPSSEPQKHAPKFDAVRVRYAPSPTGSVHLGGLRTALYNYLFARASKGKFIIRIEDTDQKRLVPGAVDELLNTLKWAGIDPDEGPHKGREPFGPYTQSERLAMYKPYAVQLVRDGFAYPCFCSPERLNQIRESAHARGQAQTFYDRHCAVHSKERQMELLQEADKTGRSYVIRLKVPGGSTVFTDLIRGKMTFPHQAIDDQVLLKSDGFPTYHLAVVVDDHLMKISHVIRGDEWLPSTAKHLLLYKMLNFPIPKFAHLPLLLKSEGIKLSKRNQDASVEYYINKGYEPSALVNYIAFLGWNPGHSRELYPNLDELSRDFTIQRVRKSGAMVDIKKLNWFNAEHMKLLLKSDPQSFYQQLEPQFMKKYGDQFIQAQAADPQHLAAIVSLFIETSFTRSDFLLQSEILYNEPNHRTPEARELRKKIWPGSIEITRNILSPLVDKLDSIPESQWKSHFHKDSVELIHKAMGEVKIQFPDLSNSRFFGIIRYSITGREFGPSLSLLMATMGKQQVIRRMKKTVALGKQKDAERSGGEDSERWDSGSAAANGEKKSE